MQDQVDKEPLEATAEAGAALVEDAIAQVAAFTQAFIDGEHRGENIEHHP